MMLKSSLFTGFLAALLQLAAIHTSAQTTPAQVAPLVTGDVLTYQGYTAEKKAFGRSPTPVWKQNNPYNRKLRLEDGVRKYFFTDGKPAWVFNESFARVESRGAKIDASEHFPLLQPGQKPAVGQQWEFVRSGSGVCGAWGVKYTAVIKDGPDVKISIKGVDTTVKTLLIEHRGISTLTGVGCDPETQERNVLYAPELGELVADQWLIFIRGDVEEGYKWSVITVK